MTNSGNSNTEHEAGTRQVGHHWVGTCQGCPWVSGPVRFEPIAKWLAGLHVKNNGPLFLPTPAPTAPEPLSRDEILDRLVDVWNDMAKALASETASRQYALESASDAIKVILSDSGR